MCSINARWSQHKTLHTIYVVNNVANTKHTVLFDDWLWRATCKDSSRILVMRVAVSQLRVC